MKKKSKPSTYDDKPEWLPAPQDINAIVGIDGGKSGEVAVSFSNGTWEFHRVRSRQERGRTELDIKANLAVLHDIATRAGGIHKIFVVYERFRQNPKFGRKTAFTIGRYDEFWRVLLAMGNFPFWSADPKTWQAVCGKEFAGEAKERARKFVESQCDLKWLDNYKKPEQLGIIDAMCIAFWAKQYLEAAAPSLQPKALLTPATRVVGVPSAA